MESIESLPDSVRSFMRSGYIISDLIRVVEELVYNSLDAGANKVSVSVGPSTGYVKVEDDGRGINRDGLALLGERYVTSKQLHGAGCDVLPRSFGFRGESLCSISDVALIELRTRIRGRPNGYHKIMKGRKCLYLGIDDERQNIGTTVTVQDIFYNQPVRRRQIQTSPKKILEAVKKFIFQIAIVRPEVSYNLVDTESEIEVFRSLTSSTPISILTSHLGVEASSLQKLSVSEGKFKLTGYVGSSCDTMSVKALQYVYINSRLIAKGPIHKLLNSLASTCSAQLIGNKAGRSKRCQPCPTYFLNLTCPLSFYNMNFDESRASAEFKDWIPVLSLIETSVSPFWITVASNGDLTGSVDDLLSEHGTWNKETNIKLCGKDLLEEHEIPKKRCKLHNDGLLELSFSPAMVIDDIREQKCSISPVRGYSTGLFTSTESMSELEMEEDYSVNSTSSDNAIDYHFDLKDVSVHHLWRTNNEPISEYPTSSRRWDSCEEDIFSRRWTGKVDRTRGTLDYYIPSEYEGNLEEKSKEDRKPNLRNCSSQTADVLFSDNGLSPCNMFGALPTDQEQQEPHRSINIPGFSEKHLYSGCTSGVIEVDGLKETDEENFFSRRWMGKVDKTRETLNHFIPNAYERNLVENSEGGMKPFLRKCSSQTRADGFSHNCLSPNDMFRALRSDEELCRSRNLDGPSGKDLYAGCTSGLIEVDELQETGDTSQGLMSLYGQSTYLFYPGTNVESDGSEDLEQMLGVPQDLSFIYQDSAARERDRGCLIAEDRASDASFPSFPEAGMGDPIFSNNPLGIERSNHNLFEKNLKSEECILEKTSNVTKVANSGDSDIQLDHEEFLNGISSSFPTFDFRKNSPWPRTEICGSFSAEEFLDGISSSSITTGGTGIISSDVGKDSSPKFAIQRSRSASAGSQLKIDLLNNPQLSSKRHYYEARVRSKSAPPIYRGKRKFLSVISQMTYVSGIVNANTSHTTCQIKDCDEIKTVTMSPFASQCSQLQDINNANEITLQKMMDGVNRELDTTYTLNEKKSDGLFDTSIEAKWRNDYRKTRCDERCEINMVREKLLSHQSESNVLDIDSEVLQLACDVLGPTSITRNCLKNTKVLLQVDKKFIPIVARSTVAVIDQHAADERVRLEDLRQKVLSGELKTITYLEAEKELILPETSHQLLYIYAEQIRSWGWICNTSLHPQPFTKNLNLLNRQPTSASLVAVPCILGVNLSDADLLEFIEQLADTDGSSTIPPSVLRVLNSKSCRGAIMFGDKLLPSECALLVDELKQTSLCFQCAHGRPTMVPLVDLKALHKQIEKLQAWNGSSGEPWHGLRRQSVSLKRSKQRLENG